MHYGESREDAGHPHGEDRWVDLMRSRWGDSRTRTDRVGGLTEQAIHVRACVHMPRAVIRKVVGTMSERARTAGSSQIARASLPRGISCQVAIASCQPASAQRCGNSEL
eukprot:scaffold8015_cov149-Isochrysis_galbana.AAC.5